MKLLILGNSLTEHGPAPDIGWHSRWGMAASCQQNDFVHRLAAKLEDAGRYVTLRWRNIAELERCQIDDVPAFLAEEAAFRPDIVVLRVCENAPGEKLDTFLGLYEDTIRLFAADPACKVLCVGSFWKNDSADQKMAAAAAKFHVPFCPLAALQNIDAYRALGQFAHEGVASHPSDAGMEAIAETIFTQIKDAGWIDDIQTAPIPEGEPIFDLYHVFVNGKEQPMYQARVSAMSFNRVWPGQQRPIEQSELAGILTFDMTAAADFTLKWYEDIHDAVVRPISKGVSVVYEGDTACFTIRQPGQYSVEINGRHHNLHIFANEPEAAAADPAAYTYYYAPGIHEVGNLRLYSGESVYVAAGAVVHGAIQVYDQKCIRIAGRGILDYSKMERHVPLHWEEDGMINLVRCDGVDIEGIILRDASWWTITSYNCRNLYFHHLKTVGMWRYNSDGFDFCNCQNVHVKGCFLRNFDDVIVFKGMRITSPNDGVIRSNEESGIVHPTYDRQNVQNHLVEDCVLWCDWGGALEIGAETVADEYCNITYRSCDIIRNDQGAMRIQSGDRAEIHHLLYENIRVEYSKYDRANVYQHADDMKYEPEDKPHVSEVIRAWMYCNMWTKDGIYGKIHDIIYRNISVYADEGLPCPQIQLEGHDDEHANENVIIENFRFNGRLIVPQIHLNTYTKQITIRNQGN